MVGWIEILCTRKKRDYVVHAKNYEVNILKQLFIKIDNIIIGLLVLMFAAILAGDAILTTFNPDRMILSPNDVKGIVGVTFVIIAIFIFIKAREKSDQKSSFSFLFILLP